MAFPTDSEIHEIEVAMAFAFGGSKVKWAVPSFYEMLFFTDKHGLKDFISLPIMVVVMNGKIEDCVAISLN